MQLAEISAFQQFAEPMELFLHRARTITGLLFLLALLSSCSGIERRDAALPSPQSTASAPENFLSDSTSIWTDSIQREEFCPVQSQVSKEREMAEEGWTVPESEATLDQEIAELEKLGSWEEGPAASEPSADQEKKTFPITINRQVEFYLDFFRNRHPQSFTRWLCRSGRYLPFIREQLQTAGLPEELAYLPLIESGFNLTAYSRARAVGPWQFMKGTGLQYGLTINSYVDERRDIVASTKAAIDLLKDLYDEFGSWNLAVAGYNAGPGTIRKAIPSARLSAIAAPTTSGNWPNRPTCGPKPSSMCPNSLPPFSSPEILNLTALQISTMRSPSLMKRLKSLPGRLCRRLPLPRMSTERKWPCSTGSCSVA